MSVSNVGVDEGQLFVVIVMLQIIRIIGEYIRTSIFIELSLT